MWVGNGNSIVEHVVIRDGIEKVSNCFNECDTLVSVSLPASLDYVDAAFNRCGLLEDMEGGAGISYVCNSFYETRWMEHQDEFVIVGNGELVAYKGSNQTVSTPEEVRVIARNAFESNSNVETIILSEGLERIEYGAFAKSGLREIIGGINVVYVGA